MRPETQDQKLSGCVQLERDMEVGALAGLVAQSCEIVSVLVSACIRKRARAPTRSGKLPVMSVSQWQSGWYLETAFLRPSEL